MNTLIKYGSDVAAKNVRSECISHRRRDVCDLLTDVYLGGGVVICREG